MAMPLPSPRVERFLLALVLLCWTPSAAALPAHADLSHPLATGWTSFVCGGFIPEICIDATVDHDLTIHLPDGSSVVWRIEIQASGALSSIHEGRPRYTQWMGIGGGQLAALDEHLVPYSTTSYDLFVVGDTAYENFDFDEWAPTYFRYTTPGGKVHLLLGDGSGHFVPEPGAAALLGLGTLALARAARRPGGSS